VRFGDQVHLDKPYAGESASSLLVFIRRRQTYEELIINLFTGYGKPGKVLEIIKCLFPCLEKSWEKIKSPKFCKIPGNYVIFICSFTQFD